MRLAYAWFALACVAFVVVALGCLALAFYRTGMSYDHGCKVLIGTAIFLVGVPFAVLCIIALGLAGGAGGTWP